MIKKKTILLCLYFAVNLSLNAQNFGMSLSARYGTPTQFFDFFQHPDPQNPTEADVNLPDNIITTSDIGFLSAFNYRFIKKWELHGAFGLEYARSNFYKTVVLDGRRLDVITFDNERLSAHLGLFKRFNFYDNRLSLELGFSFQKRFFLHDEQVYSQDLSTANKPLDWFEYEYELITYHDGMYGTSGFQAYKTLDNIHFELNSKLSFQLYKNLHFSFGFDYNRNHVFYFDYSGKAIKTQTDGTSGNTTITVIEKEPYIGDNGAKRSVRSHFLYLNFGLSWRF